MIEFTDVTKRYRKVKAIDHLSLNIPEDGIYCLLGRNGAGKTTFMKLLAGHISASFGKITIDSHVVSPGRMPAEVNFFESGAAQFNMKLYDLFDNAAALQEHFDIDFALEMARRFELDLNKKFKHLSFGMKIMMGAVLSLANNAEIILLDEPTLGFDAIMRDQFNTLLLESYTAHPRVLIVSTHLIDEISKVSQRLIIIDKGKLLMEAGIDDIDEKAYSLSGPAQAVSPLLDGLNCISRQTLGGLMVAHIYDDRITPPQGVLIDRLGLQDFFISIVGGDSHE